MAELSNPEELNEISAKIPLKIKMTIVEEIAKMTVFLMSSKSSNTTGRIIPIDGGYVHLNSALANA